MITLFILSTFFRLNIGMGHRVNTTVTKRTKGLKTSHKSTIIESEEDQVIKISKLDTEDVLSSLGVFPSYSVLFREAHSAIFSDNGPLSVSTRHFIALSVSTTS